MNHKDLDIIITHYNEPWEKGRPMFDMIQHQRLADMDRVQITLVQDGEEGALPWEDLLSQYSYSVNIITIPHSGTAVARNAGMDRTSADWIMFCDFDDMFADIGALDMILDLFPVKDYDMFWGRMLMEYRWNMNGLYFNKCDSPNYAETNCMFYRREFLKENNIRFNTKVPMWYEYIFNSMIIAITPPFRIAAMTTDFYVYLKTYNEGGLRHTIESRIEYMNARFQRGKALADEFLRRGMDYDYRKTVASIIFQDYFRVYMQEDDDNIPPESPEFISYFKKHRDVLNSLTETELDVIKDFVENEIMELIQSFYNMYKKEYYYVNDEVPFDEWLKKMDGLCDGDITNADHICVLDPKDQKIITIPNEPVLVKGNQYHDVRQSLPPEDTPSGKDPRVVVYCGTYNTYMNMMTSAKSLLYHTRVDKIYFLIEDDTFPYDLPPIIECINVKNQEWFPEDGPNYKNDWSYMCMMRAAFTKLIPYKKILSLDIDVVIQTDIGCLWDDYDLTDYYLAGVIEPVRQKSTQDPIYINFGVVMMNLDKIRKDGIDDKVIESLNTRKWGCPEQDAFNHFCAWHILQLPNDYNATVNSHITGECEHEHIIHYAGIKFWRHFGAVKEYGLKSWEQIMERQAKLHG